MVKLEKVGWPGEQADRAHRISPAALGQRGRCRHGRLCCASTPSACASWWSGTCCTPAARAPRHILDNWDAELGKFVKVMPTDFAGR
jgi:hypothetical protein